MLHKSGWETDACAEDHIPPCRASPQDGVCILNRLTMLVQKVVARIPVSCVHDSFSASTVALTKSI
jgi:hypothetical protein